MEFDFAANKEVPSLEKVPEDFRGLYKQNGEKFVLDSEHVGVKSSIAVITGLNTALKAARLEAKNKAPVDLSPLKDFGNTPEEIKTKVAEKVASLEEQIKGVNVDKIRKDLASEYESKVTQATQEKTTLQSQLYTVLVEGSAASAIASEKGEVELLMPFVKNHVKTMVVDGRLAVRVVDGAGDVRFSGLTGKEMTVQELVKEMKGTEKYGRLFASEQRQGGGTPPGGAQPARQITPPGTTPSDQLNATQKIARGLAASRGRR